MDGHRAGELIAQRYRVIDTLGVGGYGAVYECLRVVDGARVAVKVMHERLGGSEIAYARFEREAQMVQRLHHPNIVAPIDYGMTEQRLPYIAFELLDGVTLKRELEDKGALGVLRAAFIGRQMLTALACAHGAGVVHRDVKPANVFLCRGVPPDRDVKMLDFGIAKASDGQGMPHLTATGQMLGTPQYMAPEQVRGSRHIDGRADLYAVGTVLAELVSGRKLVAGDTDIEVFMAHISDEPLTLPPGVAGSALGHIISRAVAKQPDHRYPSAGAMLADLDAVLAGLQHDAPTWSQPRDNTFVMPPSAPPMAMLPSAPPPVAPPSPSGGTRSWLPLIVTGAIAAALVLGAGAGVVAWSIARTAEPAPPASPANPEQLTDQNPAIARGVRIRRRLVEQGFDIIGEQGGKTPGVSHFSIGFQRGDNSGHVSVFHYDRLDVATAAHDNLSRSPSMSVIREGQTVIAVGYPVDAWPLVRKLAR